MPEFVKESPRFLSILNCPFSRRGSYLYFASTGSEHFGKAYLTLNSGRGVLTQKNRNRLLDVQPLHEGSRVPFAILMQPSQLTLRTLYGDIRFCFAEERLILFETDPGLGLRFASSQDKIDRTAKPRGENGWEIQFDLSPCLVLHASCGNIRASVPWDWDSLRCGYTTLDVWPDENGSVSGSLEEFISSGCVRASYPSYAEGLAAVTGDWENFLAGIPVLPQPYDSLRARAAWNLWNYIVSPSGYIRRPYLYMRPDGPASQWQTTFQSVAFGENIRLGWDQFMLPFDHQSETGQLPDYYADSYGAFGNIRPPLQGWALKQMKLRGLYQKQPIETIRDLYPRLALWADWFARFRTEGPDGLPHYEHSDESGMEDGSTFRHSFCMITPDLPAYLVLLFEELGEMAAQLGMDPSVKAEWDRKADAMLRQLIDRLWDEKEERFLSHTVDGKPAEGDSGILGYIPVILGHRLPEPILSALIRDLKKENDILSPYGFNKERCSAEDLCNAARNGVRGMIYHPFNVVLISALWDCGEKTFAADVARRYCGEMVRVDSLCQWLNIYDGGIPGDVWISWTAGAYLLIAQYTQE